MIFKLNPLHPHFPDPNLAETQPDGLLAFGGSLHPSYALTAYAQGIFPWFNEDQKEPIVWWSPSTRAVLLPSQFQINKSFSKVLRNRPYEIRIDSQPHAMIEACANQSRKGQPGTWIGSQMQSLYRSLSDLGVLHSVEVWVDGLMTGGLFGIQIGRVFIGESMFSSTPDASKIALAHLCFLSDRIGIDCIECQFLTDHLSNMGAHTISRQSYLSQLQMWRQDFGKSPSWPQAFHSWKDDYPSVSVFLRPPEPVPSPSLPKL